MNGYTPTPDFRALNVDNPEPSFVSAPTLQEAMSGPDPFAPHRHSGHEMLQYGRPCPVCAAKEIVALRDQLEVAKPLDMSLCEINALVLKPNQIYRFQQMAGCKACEDYANALPTVRQQEIELGLANRDNSTIRVKWVNALRAIVAKRCPVNKMGAPLVTDVDLLLATDAERREALEIFFQKQSFQ